MAPQNSDRSQLDEIGNVRPLRPARILVAGRDARYARSTAFLLGRRGYEIRRVRHGRSLVGDPRLEAADVVLLEDEASPAAAEEEAGRIVAASLRVSVVIACERRPFRSAERIQFVEKWAPFEDVIAAVNRAWASLGPTGVPARAPQAAAAAAPVRLRVVEG